MNPQKKAVNCVKALSLLTCSYNTPSFLRTSGYDCRSQVHLYFPTYRKSNGPCVSKCLLKMINICKVSAKKDHRCRT